MNRIYRLVFNRTLGLIQVAPETARARAGTAAQAGRIGRRSAVGIAPLSLLALGLMMAASTVRADSCHWWWPWPDATSDGDWFNPDNWSCLQSVERRVPTSDDHVIIDRPYEDVAIDGDAAESSSLLLGSGQLTIRNGGTLQTGTAGYHTIGQATLTVTGSGSAWNVAGGLIRVGRRSIGTLVLREGGALNAGNSTLVLGESEAYYAMPGLGTLVIGAAAGEQAVAPGTIEVAAIEMGRQNGTAEAAGRIVFNHTDTSGAYTFAPDIAGSGAIEHHAGTTVLSGTNTYTGGTRLLGGTLSVSSDSALGAPSSALHFDGGMLQVTGRDFDATTRAITLGDGGGGFDIADAGHRFTLAQDITGSGALVKDGAGTLVLEGDNAYTGGTRVLAGTLVGHAGSFGSGGIEIGTGAFLRLNQATDAILSSQVSGTGHMIKEGAGTLALDGGEHHLGNLYLGRYESVGTWAPVDDGGTLQLRDGATLQATGGLYMNRVRTRVTLELLGEGTSATFGASALIGDTGSEARVVIRDGARLENGNAVVGNLNDSQGFVTVTGEASLWRSNGFLHVGGNGQSGSGSLRVEHGGRVESGIVRLGYGSGATGDAVVTGAGSRWDTLGEIRLGEAGNGTLLIDDGAVVTSRVGTSLATGHIASYNAPSSRGSATIRNGGAWIHEGGVVVGQYEGSEGSLTLASGGRVQTGTGTGGAAERNMIRLAGYAGSRGTLNIGAASGETAEAAGILVSERVEFGAGEATLVFNHTDDIAFGAVLLSTDAGTHALHHLAGTTTLAGDSSGFAGATTVAGGTLLVDGALGGHITVQDGGTLGGSGTVADTRVRAGGTLSAGNSPGTLQVDGDLVLEAGSRAVFELNGPGVAGGTGARGNDLVEVAGDLSLDGQLDARVAAAGYYRLFHYGGALTGAFAGGTVTGTAGFQAASDSPDLRYDVAGQVNLVVLGAGQTMQFWDGGDTAGNGTVDGGDGLWQGFGTNWTDADGAANAGWGGSVGVFAGTAGTVTVQDTQRFDTLQFSTDGYRIEGDALRMAATAGGSFNVDAGVTATVASRIEDGAGSVLRKAGGGTLVLEGDNAYTGGTHLLGGTLSVASDAALGAGAGALHFDGGMLQVTGRDFDATTRAITLGDGGGGFDIADAGHRFTLAQDITGSGALVKDGAGTLVLEGDNAYTGGTRIEGGTLSVSSDSALGATSGDIALAGGALHAAESFDSGRALTLESDGRIATARDATLTLSGSIGGDGVLVKDGAGTLVLTGTNRYRGGTRVEAGALVGHAAGFGDGDIRVDDGASLRFDQHTTASLAAALSGAGDIVKEGEGGLTLAGDSSGFTGTTTVSAGTLRVDGLLGGRVTVEDGATLGGAGTVGDTTVQAGATLAPGNSIGTLRIDGDLVFQAGARYEVEVDPAGTGSDLVEVTGTASLQGGSVVHIGANDGYRLRSTYRILSAGSLQGTFDTVSSDFAFLAPELAYDHQAGTVDLTLVRNDRDFASVASTRNQKATAAGIESIGLEAGHAVHDAIAQMPDDAALIRAGFDALSGEAHASARALLLDDAGWLADAVTRRHAGAAATGELTPATTLWLDAGGGQARTGSDGNGARWQGNAHGLAVGADVEVGPGRIGLAAGKRRTNQQVSDRSSRNRIDSRHLALHAAATLGPVQLAGGVARGRYTLELDRRVALAEIDETLASSSDAEADVLFLEASLAEPARGVAPWLGIRQVRLDSDPARESGGSAALSVAGGRHDLGSATLGVLADRRLGDGSRLQARLGWRHAWGDLTPWATVAFDAGDAFTVYAPAMARNSLVYALDLGLATGPRSRLALGMAGQAGDGSRAWGAQLQWQATF